MTKHRTIAVILLAMLCIMYLRTGTAQAEQPSIPVYLDIDRSAVAEVEIYGGYHEQDRIDHQYRTENSNEIDYLVHYFNSFSLVEADEKRGGSDYRYFHIKFTEWNTSFVYYFLSGFYSKGYTWLDSPDDRQYATNHIEYARFMELVHAFKVGDFRPSGSATFTPSPWAAAAVQEAVGAGFVPKMNQIDYVQNINRLEFCQIVYAFLQEQGIITEEPEVTFEPFGDTLDPAVIALYNAGIVQGTSDTHFSPFASITREELAVILNRVIPLMELAPIEDGPGPVYADAAQFSPWAQEGVKTISALQIMQGKDNAQFAPRDHTTKEESIVTLLRLYHLAN